MYLGILLTETQKGKWGEYDARIDLRSPEGYVEVGKIIGRKAKGDGGSLYPVAALKRYLEWLRVWAPVVSDEPFDPSEEIAEIEKILQAVKEGRSTVDLRPCYYH